MTSVCSTPLEVAVRVTFCVALTADAFKLNVALVFPLATLNEEGVVTLLLLLESLTISWLLVASVK
jgi:uncharacterized membrane protein